MADNSENCTHNCSSCSSNCKSRDLHVSLREGASVKKVIAIVSGKGGVGKSLVTSLLACKMNKLGKKTAILDADITGPSIPESFGLSHERAVGDGNALFPVMSKKGIQLMSMNFLLEHENDPVIWRGPVIAGAVKQFWTDVNWKDVDYMFVDMPPGTGDVPLTVFQSLPISGIIVVSSPQQLVSVIVQKALKMAKTMNIPVLGLIENMSYVKCPDCDKEIKIYGESNIEEVAAQFEVPLLGKIPIEQNISSAVDSGNIEDLDIPYVDKACEAVQKL